MIFPYMLLNENHIKHTLLRKVMLNAMTKHIFNSCKKEVYLVNDWELLKRFLMLGCEKGTYYISSTDLTKIHLDSLDNLIKSSENHEQIIDIIKTYNGKSYKRDYLIYLLASCCAYKESPNLRDAAYSLLETICIIPTYLFMFIEMYEKIHNNSYKSTGWNHKHKRAIASWYINKKPLDLIYTMTKYKNRNGWRHEDVLRLTHIKKPNSAYDQIFKYVTAGFESYTNEKTDKDQEILDFITAYENLSKSDISYVIENINKFNFAREHIPNTLLGDKEIWNALCQKMPMTALLRNINKITSCGVLDSYPETLDSIITKLTTQEIIHKSKVHPLQFLITTYMYSSGSGFKGSLQWTINSQIVSALNIAFKLSFKNVQPTNMNYLLALDVSGSMSSRGSVAGIECMTAAQLSCAMAMIIANTEKNYDIMGFSQNFKKLDINPDNDLNVNLNKVHDSNFGNTDCSLPMEWATKEKKSYDCIIIFTDSETNCNTKSPSESLKDYRKVCGKYTKLIVIATSANKFSIADPDDIYGMLDIAGFSADTPSIIADFISL